MVGWRIHRLGASSTNSNPPKGRERGSSRRQALGRTPAPDGGGQWAAPGVLQVRPCLCCASARGVCGLSGMRLSWRRDVVTGRHDRGRGWRSAGSGVVRVFCSVFGPSRPPAGAAPKGGDVAYHRRAAALSSMGPADELSVVSPCFVGRRVVLDGSPPPGGLVERSRDTEGRARGLTARSNAVQARLGSQKHPTTPKPPSVPCGRAHRGATSRAGVRRTRSDRAPMAFELRREAPPGGGVARPAWAHDREAEIQSSRAHDGRVVGRGFDGETHSGS